jgi:hypothetical protein
VTRGHGRRNLGTWRVEHRNESQEHK